MFGWNPSFITSLGLMFYFMIPGMTPPEFQRISMARDTAQVKHAFSIAAVVDLLIVTSVVWVGILLLSQDAALDPEKLVHYLITQYTYPGLKGLIGIGIMALAMSTADSYLNSSAVLLAHDIIRPLGFAERKLMIVARVLSLIIGIFALLLALRIDSLLRLLLLSGSFFMPIYTVPLLMAIFGFRSGTRAVLIGMALGFCTVVLCRMFMASSDGIAPGMLANQIGRASCRERV